MCDNQSPLDCLYGKIRCLQCVEWLDKCEGSHGYTYENVYYKCLLSNKKQFANKCCTLKDAIICPILSTSLVKLNKDN